MTLEEKIKYHRQRIAFHAREIHTLHLSLNPKEPIKPNFCKDCGKPIANKPICNSSLEAKVPVRCGTCNLAYQKVAYKGIPISERKSVYENI
jgi:RNase P subunit RPR2